MKPVQIKTHCNQYCGCREPGYASLGSAQSRRDATLLLNAPHAETARWKRRVPRARFPICAQDSYNWRNVTNSSPYTQLRLSRWLAILVNTCGPFGAKRRFCELLTVTTPRRADIPLTPAIALTARSIPASRGVSSRTGQR